MKKLHSYMLLILSIIFIPILVKSDTLYKLREITVPNERDAINIINHLNRGVAFSKEALQKYNISISIENMGWVYLDKMAPEYSVVSKLKKNEYTKKPINHLSRYQIVKVDNLKTQKKPSLKTTEFVFINSVTQYLQKENRLKRSQKKGIYKSKKNNIELRIENANNFIVESATISIKFFNEKVTRKNIDTVLPIIKGFIIGSNPSISIAKAELLALDLVSSVSRLDEKSIISGVQFSDINYSFLATQKEKSNKKYTLIEITAVNMNSIPGQVFAPLMKKHNPKRKKENYLARISAIFN